MSAEQPSQVEILRLEVLARVGRNLLIYQSIEHSLKSLIPLSHPNGSAQGDDAFESLSKDLSAATMGPLVATFQESFQTIAKPDEVNFYLRGLVRARNDLVHDFLRLPSISVDTEDGCVSAIAYLDDRLSEAIEFQKLLESMHLHASKAFESADQATFAGIIHCVQASGLPTNQGVGGSTPAGRATLKTG